MHPSRHRERALEGERAAEKSGKVDELASRLKALVLAHNHAAEGRTSIAATFLRVTGSP